LKLTSFQPLLIFYFGNKIPPVQLINFNNFILPQQKKKQQRTTTNLILQNRKTQLFGTDGTVPPLQKQWAALRAAVQLVGRKSKSFIVEYIYNEARTHFMENE